MYVSASMTVLYPPWDPNIFVSPLENSGLRLAENFAGSKAPRVVWNTQTYSWWLLFASDWVIKELSTVDIGVQSEKPLPSTCTAVGMVTL